MMRMFLAAAIAILAAQVHAGDIVHVSPDDVGPESIVYWQGEYVGTLEGEEESDEVVAAQVVARRNDNYELVLYRGGLPGDGWDPDSGKQRLSATLSEGRLVFEEDDCTYKVENGTIEVSHEERSSLGTLERMFRTSPTLGLGAPEGAVVLFDGNDVDKWRDGATITDDGLLEQGARTAEQYGDIFVHVEYMLPFWDHSRRANSGVYIQDRYEVQILDSFGHGRGRGEDGSLYRERAPDVNVTLPPYHWQTFDILFRAPRFDDDGNKTENVRISVIHNGVLIHDDVELEGGTGRGGRREEVPREHLYLQQHRGPGLFRNVWLIEDPDDWPEAIRERVFE